MAALSSISWSKPENRRKLKELGRRYLKRRQFPSRAPAAWVARWRRPAAKVQIEGPRREVPSFRRRLTAFPVVRSFISPGRLHRIRESIG